MLFFFFCLSYIAKLCVSFIANKKKIRALAKITKNSDIIHEIDDRLILSFSNLKDTDHNNNNNKHILINK